MPVLPVPMTIPSRLWAPSTPNETDRACEAQRGHASQAFTVGVGEGLGVAAEQAASGSTSTKPSRARHASRRDILNPHANASICTPVVWRTTVRILAVTLRPTTLALPGIRSDNSDIAEHFAAAAFGQSLQPRHQNRTARCLMNSV